MTTILKEEEDERADEIEIIIAGLKMNTRMELNTCLEDAGCTTAGCSEKTINSGTFCVPDELN